MRWLWALLSVGLASLVLWGCANALLPNVALDAPAEPAPPPILGTFAEDAPVETAADWAVRRAPLLRAALSEAVYGPAPPPAHARVLERADIAYAPLADVARIEQWSIGVSDEADPPRFNLVLVTPKTASAPAPLIVMENFCGNRAAFAGRPQAVAAPLTPVLWVCDAPWADPAVEAVFGRYISIPPYEDILAHGYALAMFYAGDVVGDEPASARAGLARLYGERAEQAGAVAVWAWLYSRAIDVLAEDSRIDAARIAVWGHSRNGKAALLAAADDLRIAAVISHQSGRGGAALTHGAAGESLAEIMKTYGYWFTPAFAHADKTDPELDQHQLLALIAPRPMLLGNGRRDAWADPASAFRAARSADAVYELMGSRGLDQARMDENNISADIAFTMRGGLHGVTVADWRFFLAFLDAHLKPAPSSSPAQ
jgi:hypothetical protein